MGVYIPNFNLKETDEFNDILIEWTPKDGHYDERVFPLKSLIDLDLVRCGECRYRDTDECRWLEEERPNDDDFCSYAERRTNENALGR